jgi:hypothetical protein
LVARASCSRTPDQAPAGGADRRESGGAIVALFFGAATALLIPRADHVAYITAPAVLVVVGAAVPLDRRALARGWGFAALTAAAVLAAPLAATAVVVDHDWDASRQLAMVHTRHFRGALTDRRTWDEIVADTRRLRSSTGPNGLVFIISQKAGLYYLVGDLENPTPYDYPDRTEFGRDGVHRVEDDLQRGVIEFSCIDRTYGPDLAPADVIAAVRRHSHLVASLHICDLWATDITGA